MKKEKSNKKRKTIISLMLLLCICVIGVSYAVYNYTFIGNKNTLETADISLELIESNTNIVTIENALPISDNEGKTQEETFDFAVTSKTNRNVSIRYTLSIEKLTVDANYTSLGDNQVKLYLTDFNNNQLLGPTTISSLNKYRLYIGNHNHDSTHEIVKDKFKLRAWVDSYVNASDWNSSTKLQYKFKIGVTGEEDNTFAVYRYGANKVYTGTTLNSTTGTKWIVKIDGTENEDLNTTLIEEVGTYYWDTYEECTSVLSSFGITAGEEIEGNTYTCEGKNGTFGGIGSYTDNYTSLNKQFLLKHIINNNKVESSEVCFLLDNELNCIVGEDETSYENNKQLLLNAFGTSKCTVYSSYIKCTSSGLQARAYQIGSVDVYVSSSYCTVQNSGSSYCVN